MSHLELVALVVKEYQPAIDFFVDVLQFDLVEDMPSLTNDGRPKRWVVVRPPGGATGILLARADGDRQSPWQHLTDYWSRVGVEAGHDRIDRLTSARRETIVAPVAELSVR